MRERIAVKKARYFLEAARFAPAAGIGTTALLVCGFWSADRSPLLLAWFAATSAICVYGHFYVATARRSFSKDVGAEAADDLFNRATWLLGADGVLWGALCVYLYLETEGYARALTLLAPCLIAAGSVLLFAGAFRVIVSAVTPMLLLAAGVNAWDGDLTHWVLSFGIVLLGIVCAVMGKRQEDLLAELFEKELKNEELLLNAKRDNEEITRSHAQYRDVQEAARLQLEQETRLAKDGERWMQRFVARASHDLRQPMSALQNFLEVARHWHEKQDHAKVGQILQRAVSSVSALSVTFSRILDVARYDSGEYRPRIEPVDLSQILSDIEEQNGPLAASKGIELRVRRPRQVPIYADTDPDMLWRILSNLVGNAIKFTPASSAERRSGVLIAAVRISNRLRVDVCDNGIGVAKPQFDSIWEPFYQVHDRERNREHGLGLGLSIVRAACDALGHELEFRSVLGKGSRFSVELPVSATQPVDAHPRPEDPGKDRIEGASVVLVEDDRDARESLAELLQTWGAQVLSCGSIAEALARYGELAAPLGAIVTDFRLSESETGAEAIAALRARQPRGDAVPAIVVTGNMLGEVPSLEHMPKVRVLQKPVKPMRLRSTLNALLRNDLQE